MTRNAVTAQWFEKYRVRLILLRASPYVWFGGFFLFSFIVLYPITGLQHQSTIDQFNQLPQLPNARRIDYGEDHKPDQLFVHARYATDKDYSQTPAAYLDAPFFQLGWQLTREELFYVPERYYCKGDYSVTVSYYGSQYEVWLIWGNASECRSVRGGARLALSLVPLLFLMGGSVSWGTYALILWRALWTMNEKELKQAMAAINGPNGIGGTQSESITIFLLSAAIFLLSSYAILTLSW